MKRKLLWGAAALVLLTAAGIFSGKELRYRFGSAAATEGIVLVPTGSDLQTLVDSLRSKGLLHNPEAFERMAGKRIPGRTVRPGRYRIEAGASYEALIRMFRGGWQTPVRVTFNNIRTPHRLAGILARKLEPDSACFLRALTSDSAARRYGYDLRTFPAMFIPDTYELYWNTSPDGFLERMHKESERFWQERDGKRSRSGLSRTEVVTLASIVYEETKKQQEMPRIAGVYINRLRKGMLLQADPTVKFALGDFGLKRVLHRHLETDSPYNTYKYAGLPPGPICMPSIAAIDAVLDFEEHGYYYFCAKEDLSGSHNFAKTLSEHNRNAQAYARALNRLRIR